MTASQLILAFHLLAIAMGVGMVFSNLVNASLSLSGPTEVQKGLGLQRRTAGRVGDIVIGLIWISGGLALWWRGHEGLSSAFAFKLAAVILLTLAHARARVVGERMRREGHLAHVGEQRKLMAAGWLLACAAVVLAVVTFG